MELAPVMCKLVNRFIPLPPHPFNLENDRIKTYAQWQFDMAQKALDLFSGEYPVQSILKDKTVLDIGCGAGGKTIYFATQGVKRIYGLDMVEHYEKEANTLSEEKGTGDVFRFVVGDAAEMSFEDSFFDTVIMNDAMEHVSRPLAVLNEACRVLKSGGRLFINFPPYFHPYGAHLSDAISIPWIHLLFNERTLIKVYKELVKKYPDGDKRISLRIGNNDNGKECLSYINKMTVKRFNTILKQTGFNILCYKEIPLRPFIKPLSKLPGIKECFIKTVLCILEKG